MKIVSNKNFNLSYLRSFYKNEINEHEEWICQIITFLTNWFNSSPHIQIKTSGSTGKPKNINLSKDYMTQSAKRTLKFFSIKPNDILFAPVPAKYIGGMMMIVRAITGKTNYAFSPPHLNPFHDVHIEKRIKLLSITPAQLFEIHSNPRCAEKLKFIDNIILGGAPVENRLLSKINQMKVNVFESFGMTETASHIALRKCNGSNASPFFTTLKDVKITKNEKECLLINDSYNPASPIQTNDLVEVTSSHSFKWLGRIDTIINSGGIKIIPETIEKKIENFIKTDFFISSRKNDTLGAKIILVIEGKEYSITGKKELMNKLKSRLTSLETPKEIYFLNNFCRTSTNKINKKETLKRL